MLLGNLVSLCALLSPALAKPSQGLPKRPNIEVSPHNTGKSFPAPSKRDDKRYCYVKPGGGSDSNDAPLILKAFKKCNNGGTVVLDKKYTVASPLDLTWLAHIDVVITGEISFKPDPDYWADNSFKFSYQNMSSFWKFGGEDIHIYGDLSNELSVLDGHGQAYWKAMQTNKAVGSLVWNDW